jgi:ubiquitin-conjugating enzyme E2 variant
MKEWNGTILGPPHVCYTLLSYREASTKDLLSKLTSSSRITSQTAHENRIYSLTLLADATYPDAPPLVRFESKVNLTCVDGRGIVSSLSSS